ncbi:cytochrome c biogenesis protein ResB [Rhodococcus sp. IEGM 1408]|uniref:cytochrome c biogenesis protein ResB n=1 Tax=Rhodococcus sp. IEGM 1408 TaxID=3082220 RepID=UPI002952C1C1|nr:cytochrome c biogenesis protein ResB [Rhodococcus sp. IEGM 1408]MDV8001517.1 cytochrome c biogenesis protein ResB [Rhodococcus sp. IEGM 1408]
MPEPRTADARSAARSPVGAVIAFLRNSWRTLTAMRTALILLFLLAVAAIPGALLPQRSLNQGNVNEYIASNGWLGETYDKLQLFDVFSSWWFTAIYVLLFVSLVGCLTPRCFELVRQLRTPPPLTPRNLSRLPHHAAYRTTATPEQAADQIHKALRGRVRRNNGDGRVPGAIELSSERGYSREVGNIVFHFGLLALLIFFAAGKFVYAEGMRVIIANAESPAFCNTTPSAYDAFRAGLLVDGTDLEQFCIKVSDFRADYLPNGQAEMFTSNVRFTEEVTTTDPDTWQPYEMRVNHPLRVGGTRVYLQGHGFAPTFTVTYPNGETRTDTQQWQPTELQTFLSSGIVRFDPPAGLYPELAERRENQIAVQGLFAPTASFDGTILSSRFPRMDDPAVAIDVYQGDAGLDTGRPQSVFSLDSDLIESGVLERQARVNLFPGESTTLPDGTQVRFDGAEEFVNIQVSEDPTQIWVGVSAAVMMAGLVLSLMVRRRRIWARVTVDDDGVTRVDLGGLAKTDRSGWGSEFDDLRNRLVAAPAVTPVLPDGALHERAESGHTSPSRGTTGDDPRKDDTR